MKTSNQLQYQEFLPSSAMTQYLAGHWKFVVPANWDGPLEHIAPPDGCVSLFMCKNASHHFQFIGLLGPQLNMLETTFMPDSVYWGIRFFPGAFPCFFDHNIEDLPKQGELLPQGEWNDPFFENLNPDFEDAALFEHNLLKVKRKEPDLEVAKVVREIIKTEGQVKVAVLVQQAFVSERQLQKRFRKAVGLSMKELARVFRLRAALAQLVLQEQGVLDISFDKGFYDQSHFLHEFQRFARQKPDQVKRYLRSIQHHNVHW